jgi:response regulator RpfG family c-di-GMP phosphodiesterase
MATILLLYEGRTAHLAMEKLLRNVGYDVIATDNPSYAANVFSRIAVDLVLIHTKSAEAPNLALLSAIRAETQLNHLPVLVTGSTEESMALYLAREMGATDLVIDSKNFEQDLLYQVRRYIHSDLPAVALPGMRVVSDSPRLG